MLCSITFCVSFGSEIVKVSSFWVDMLIPSWPECCNFFCKVLVSLLTCDAHVVNCFIKSIGELFLLGVLPNWADGPSNLFLSFLKSLFLSSFGYGDCHLGGIDSMQDSRISISDLSIPRFILFPDKFIEVRFFQSNVIRLILCLVVSEIFFKLVMRSINQVIMLLLSLCLCVNHNIDFLVYCF